MTRSFVLFLTFLVGCASPEYNWKAEQRIRTHLSIVAEAYQRCRMDGKPVANLEELLPYFPDDGQETIRLIKDGAYKIVWNVKLEDGPNAILAYQNTVPTSVGFVLLNESEEYSGPLNQRPWHIDIMLAGEFKQAMAKKP